MATILLIVVAWAVGSRQGVATSSNTCGRVAVVVVAVAIVLVLAMIAVVQVQVF